MEGVLQSKEPLLVSLYLTHNKRKFVVLKIHLQNGFQTLLVHRHLDRNVREVIVNGLVRSGLHRRVELGVFVEVCYGADAL